MILVLFGKGHTMTSWPTLGHGCCFAISHPHLLHTKIHRFSNTHRYTDTQTHTDTDSQTNRYSNTQRQTDTEILKHKDTQTHSYKYPDTQNTSTDTYRLNNIPLFLCIHHNVALPHFVGFRFLPNAFHCDHVPGFV